MHFIWNVCFDRLLAAACGPVLREIVNCYVHVVVGTRRLIRLFYKKYAKDQKAPKCAFLSFPERSFFSFFFLLIAKFPFRHT